MQIKNRIVGTGEVSYKDLVDFQPDDFKSTTPERMEKLKLSLKTNGITSPFFVWLHDDAHYTLDGHHRLRAIKELAEEGHEIEKVPVVYIGAKDESEAKKAILLFNSHYADIDKDSLMDFLADIEQDEDEPEIVSFLDLPNIDLEQDSDTISKVVEDAKGYINKRDAKYQNNVVRSMVLYYPLEDYSELVRMMNEKLKETGIDNYAELILEMFLEQD